MTAQVNDSLLYLAQEYMLAAFSNGEPFSPGDAGFRPVSASTACWRGYVCGYEVVEDQLTLRDFWVNHQPGDAPITRRLQPPSINQVEAVRDEKSYFGEWHFSNVCLSLPYSGSVLIGSGFIRDLHVHMGFHPAWKYEQVHELAFERGQLVDARDASEELMRLRGELRAGLKPDSQATREQIKGWIADCFSRDYAQPLDR